MEFSQLRARSEEQERHISFLKEALEKAGHREEDLKNMHNNYFLQVQTLINQKAIGSTTKKEEGKKGERHATEKGTTPQRGENALIEKICKNCLQPFLTENPKKHT